MCEAGKWGDKCNAQCSSGCRNICHHVNGSCKCKGTFYGDQCNQQKPSLKEENIKLASKSSKSFVIKWTEIPKQEIFYKVYYWPNNSEAGAKIAIVTEPEFNVTKLIPGKQYTFKVIPFIKYKGNNIQGISSNETIIQMNCEGRF